MTTIKMTREKETFKFEDFVNINSEDVKCYVNYERLTFKVQPVVTLVHGWDEGVQEVFSELIFAGVEECKARLQKYREEAGIGTQTDLFEPVALASDN
jgi:hypothetical protein